jgi:hypothetical protein
MDRARISVVVLLGASLLATSCGSSRQASSLPGLTAGKLVELTAKVRRAARVNGDSHPSSVMVFASRGHEANTVAGAGVPGKRRVYLVVVHGWFVCHACSSPGPPAKVPRVNVITMVVDRRTLQNLGGSIGGNVHTSKLGPGLALALG